MALLAEHFEDDAAEVSAEGADGLVVSLALAIVARTGAHGAVADRPVLRQLQARSRARQVNALLKAGLPE